jgi:hypothetical protein
MRLTPLTARLTGPAFRFFAAFFFAGRAFRAFTALAERAVFLADFFAAFFFDGRLAAFFAFLPAFFLATRLAI